MNLSPAFKSGKDLDGESEDISNLCEINVAKQRNGPTGTVKAHFGIESGRFAGWSNRQKETPPWVNA